MKEAASDFIKRKNGQFKKNPVVGAKDIGRKGRRHFVREAWTFMVQSDLDQKVFVFERLRSEAKSGQLAYKDWKKGVLSYRIGYYIVGRNGNTKDRWVWGQFCPMIPLKDLSKLLKKAKDEKTLV